jgi:hypothetical protein
MQTKHVVGNILLSIIMPVTVVMTMTAVVSTTASAEPPALMPIEDIRPGMKGIGKSVFAGTTIEEFDVEILAVLHNDGQHGDTIMAEVSGGPLPLEKVGVIAGMSGSPIYIDGKLIGALAFTQSFDQEPMIAGITPIHEMLADASRGSQNGGTVAWSNPSSESAWWNPVFIQNPLVVSNNDSRLLGLLREEFKRFAMLPVQGGSTTGAMLQEFSPELEPGASVGVQLIRGDMNATSFGTVTYRDEDQILAFGHPMFWAGDVDLPMTSAYVHFVWSNQVIPFKVASPLHTIGAITQDRRTGISGKIGIAPAMIPLDISLKYVDDQLTGKTYAFEVINHPNFTPMLLGTAGVNALLAAEGPLGKATVSTQATLELRDYPPVVLENVATGEQELLMAVLRAFAPLETLLNNPFTPVALERASLEMTVSHEIQAAELVGARIETDVVRAGETVEVMLDVRPYDGEGIETIVEQITIPEVLQDELVQLMICDAATTTMIEMGRATGKFQPQNVEQLITLFNEQMRQDQIVLSILQIKPGLVVEGRELPSPPLSMLKLMATARRSSTNTSLTRGRLLLQKHIPTPYVISGCTALGLRVDHSGGSITKTKGIGKEPAF